MPERKVHINEDSESIESESAKATDSKMMAGKVDIKIEENMSSTMGTFEMKENGATYSVGSEMLKNLKTFFRWGLKNKHPFPTLLLWYKGLSREQKKSVMIISKERTENDSYPDRKMEE